MVFLSSDRLLSRRLQRLTMLSAAALLLLGSISSASAQGKNASENAAAESKQRSAAAAPSNPVPGTADEPLARLENPADASASAPAEPAAFEERRHQAGFPPCGSMPAAISSQRPFIAGELLTFDLDVTGAAAGSMTMETSAARQTRRTGADGAAQNLRMSARTGAFFSKIKATSVSFHTTIDLKKLIPTFSKEDITVDGNRYSSETFFSMTDEENPSEINAVVKWKNSRDGLAGSDIWPTPNGALDYLSAFYFFRSLQLKPGDSFCVDVMVLRKLWRLEGTVVGREHAATPAGEFDVLHLAGKTALHEKPDQFREIHFWVSDDRFRLPVAAMGVVRQGTLRAVLSAVHRSDLKLEPARPNSLKW